MPDHESVHGVVTVCNTCGRSREGKENFGDPCKRDGCKGILAQHEDGLHLEIRRLQGIAEGRTRPAESVKPKKGK